MDDDNSGLVFDGGELIITEVQVNLDNFDRTYWRTKEGKLIPIKSMDDNHLRNTALMLMGFSKQKYNAPERLKVLWLTALKIEWNRRMEILRYRAENAEYFD